MRIQVTNTPEDLLGLPPIEEFKRAYENTKSGFISGYSVLTNLGESGPDKMGMVICRCFIEKSEQSRTDQKFILTIRFLNFGDMVIMDLVSIDLGFHREITSKHLSRMDWKFLGGIGQTDELSEATSAPLVVTGGHLRVNYDDSIELWGSSDDFGNNIFASNSVNIASNIAYVSNLKVGEANVAVFDGALFIADFIEFISQNKGQGFYEKFIDFVRDKNPELFNDFTSQHMGGLVTMKAFDRAISEEKSILTTIVEEMSVLGNYFIVSGGAKFIKKHRESVKKV